MSSKTLCVIVRVFICLGVAGREKSKGIVQGPEAFWEAQSLPLGNDTYIFLVAGERWGITHPTPHLPPGMREFVSDTLMVKGISLY